MPNYEDLTGRRFGRYTVLEYSHRGKNWAAHWRCQCDCGAVKVVAAGALRSGNTASCGCLFRENVIARCRENLTGRRFGRLTVIGYAESYKRKYAKWRCQCKCGKEVVTRAATLKSGMTKSCGCLVREVSSQVNRTHGLTFKIPEYRCWIGMKTRCYNRRERSWKNYGGRGIGVCASWRKSFVAFLADMGRKPTAKHSLDRINVDAGYDCGKCQDCKKRKAPANCKWATTAEQNRNQRSNWRISFGARTLTLAEWAEETGLRASLIGARLHRGWTAERALNTPKQTAKPRACPRYISETPEWLAWWRMIHRCTNPKNPKYGSYGGRGITVCKRWRNSFAAFLKDIGPRPSTAHSLDRIDNDGDYRPSNCRWATRQQQAGNRRSCHLITFRGKTLTIAEWSRRTSIHRTAITSRIFQRGWSVKKALTTPSRKATKHPLAQ